MVPTQELIKARQSLLQVIFCTQHQHVRMYGQPYRLYSTSFIFLNDSDFSGNEF